jgi:uncharacterized membrane protein YphA (DoxX/SURF4 family)
MGLSAMLRRAPGRAATGAFILNSGLEKLRTSDEDHAKGVHHMASGAFPAFEHMDPKLFLKTVGIGETVLGGALLLPIVPAGLAGVGLMTFAGSLLTMYWRTPGMHEPNDPRPTQNGMAIAKDSWMFGIGTGLVVDALTTGARDTAKRLVKRS